MNEDTIMMICVFILLFVLHSDMYNCHEGYTGRNPLARHLSLPDNVSEPNVLPVLPYYRTPNETNAITNYIYNASDGSVPTVYAYNQYMTSQETEGMIGSHDIFGPYGGTFANAQSEGFTPKRLIKQRPSVPLIEQRPAKNQLLLNTLQFNDVPIQHYPSKKNPLYLPQLNTPIEPGWRY
jgi:hypothetical protein